MQTIFINGRFLTQRVTGVQRYAHEVLRQLDRLLARSSDAQRVRLVVLAPPGTQAPPLEAIEFRRPGPLSGNAWEQFTLPWVTRGHLLYSFCATGPLLKAHQVITIHDASVYAVPQAFSRRFRLWYKFLLGVLVKRVPLVVTVSRFSQGEVARHFGCDPGKLRVCAEGWQHLERHAADESILSRHALASRRYVLAVSSPTPNKNFGLLVAAMAHLEQPDFDVVVAGDADARVFGGLELPSSPFVKRVGYVSDGELRALYEHAGVFVYPSRYEGFGIPPIEAMAAGCPVIASRAASLPEVCGDAAVYVSPDDAPGLAAAISAIMSNPAERCRLAERGRAWIGRYSWEQAARCNFGLMQECLDPSPHRAQWVDA